MQPDWEELLNREYRRVNLQERNLKGHAFTDCIQKSMRELVKTYLKFKSRGITFKQGQLYNLFIRFNPCGYILWGSFHYHFHKILKELTQNPPKEEGINKNTSANIESEAPKEESKTIEKT